MKRLALVLAFVGIVGVTALAVASIVRSRAEVSTALAVLPTIVPLPDPTLTATASPFPIPTSTSTQTSSPTFTATPTNTVTATSTLSTRVLVVTVNNPGVAAATLSQSTKGPTHTFTPPPTVNVPVPPTSVEIALASTENAISPGWVRYEDDDPMIRYTGNWKVYGDGKTFRASAFHYRYTSDAAATATLRFLGGGVRVRYVASSSAGVFEIRVDGKVVRTVDGYYPKSQDRLGAFLTTEIWGFYNGWHTLEIISTDRKNFASSGTVNAIDAIDVYRVGGVPTPLPTALPTNSATPTPSPVPAQNVVQIIAPPTIQPTATPFAPKVVSVSLLVAYDENNNKAVDPAEGVSSIPVRLVTVGTNQVIASGYTNSEGYVYIEVMTDAPIRLVVPYFSKFWNVSNSSTGDQRFTLLLPPGNQPGLIP